MKQTKHHVIHFLLFFYLFSSYLGATHIHHDALVPHDDCKVCVVVKNLHSGDMPEPVILPTVRNSVSEQIRFYETALFFTATKGFNAQAPPLFF
ncbi:MAG: hypothetical protein P794_03550 [Epsilonproteobacteria bacterium (ex Lamellibrachia satsuma)]|nr:MAG: hypothetical protein P794_03550 [Epsilonproteobacteria bacterium (ex Lamellibrachia satsuma)]